jgi:predicted metal-binding protein
VAAAIEAAGKIACRVADRHEPAGGVPQPRRCLQFAHVDVIRQRVTGGQVRCHQLQLVGVGECGRILGPQERAGVAVAAPPVGGEIPASEIRLRHHLGGGQAGSPRAAGLARGLPVPETGGDRATGANTDQPANRIVTATCGNRAGAIGVADAARAKADQPANVVIVTTCGNRAGAVGFADAAFVIADQPANNVISATCGYRPRAIGVADAASAKADQPANNNTNTARSNRARVVGVADVAPVYADQPASI